ncbi:hypothetical protein [Bradyrhizobium sp. USDA 4350]
MARVLIACEFSGTVRRAFAARGHDVWSCDLLPAEDRSNRHYVGDVRNILDDGWDLLMVAHPPCTRLCNSGVRWLSEPPTKLSADTYPAEIVEAYKAWDRDQRLAFMWDELEKGAALFSACWNAPIPRKCIENPQMHKHAKARIVNYRPAVQHVQPHWFGEPQFKLTGLYLDNLPPLAATNRLTPPKPGTDEHKAWSKVHRASPGRKRWKERSRFFDGIAEAMAAQWGRLLPDDEGARVQTAA